MVTLIPIRDPDKSRPFYEQTLGLRFVANEGGALVFAVGEQMLRLNVVEAFEPYPFSILSWRVPDIAAAIRELGERGVEFVRYPCFEQDELGVWTAPGGAAKVAWFLDPDRNGLSLVEVTGPPREQTRASRD